MEKIRKYYKICGFERNKNIIDDSAVPVIFTEKEIDLFLVKKEVNGKTKYDIKSVIGGNWYDSTINTLNKILVF